MKNQVIWGIIVFVVVSTVAVILFFRLPEINSESEVSPPMEEPPSPLLKPVPIFYTSSSELDEYGNFQFTYRSDFILEKAELFDNPKRHAVVLRHRGEPSAGTIEINVRSGGNSCAAYLKCSEVAGITIGTNITDIALLSVFDMIAETFEKL